MAVKLQGMSRKELLKLRDEVEKAIRDAETKDRVDARKAAEKAASKFGFSLTELTGGAAGRKGRGKGKKASSGVAKFANPNDPSQTWTGKGRQPQWYKDAVAKGVDPKKMAI